MPPGMRYAPTCDKVANTLLYCGVMLRKAKAVGSVLTLKIYRALTCEGSCFLASNWQQCMGEQLDNLTFHATASYETAVLKHLSNVAVVLMGSSYLFVSHHWARAHEGPILQSRA